MLKLGDRLQACRLAMKLTQKELCDLVNISEHYLSDIERGLRVPKLDTFVKLVNYLGVSADSVLQDSLIVGYRERTGELQGLVNELSADDRENVYRFLRVLIDSLQHPEIKK